jgi:hypothetical protein
LRIFHWEYTPSETVREYDTYRTGDLCTYDTKNLRIWTFFLQFV